ncbi:MAG: hypothetical protein HYZ00_14195, partial [Candidatus Hydrogenedentes bacterium]|nr:hypothetical protein [Candidatus Hydrogenedentota bacterium]
YGGKNALALEIIPPGQLPDVEYETKQLEATTGWDDHNPYPPDLNMGLWEDVYLKATGPVRVEHPYAESELSLPELKPAKLTLSGFVTNASQEAVTCSVSAVCEQIMVTQDVTLAPGEKKEVIFRPEDHPALSIANPRVWWPNPLGPQELYSFRLAAVVQSAESDAAETGFGIRDATTYINQEDWRGYRVNGENILIRGGAWMTADMLLRLDEHRYDALVRYARDANLNMLRSEGFSVRETDEMYSICDRYGVMVTQQIFGRNLPDEALAIACIEDMMLRIRNHPSLVHFLGHDETFPTETLDAAYRGLLEKYRLHRTYQPHSGAFNVNERQKTGGTRTGTRELWTYAMPSHYYLRQKDGAWGFAQSGGIGGIVAVRDSLRQMMPEDQLWPPLGTEAWSFHTVTQGATYFREFQTAMAEGYGAPGDLDDFCNKAYAMNYNSARGMFEAYGRNKYKALGITTWKYDASWPAAMTWQYVDWYLRATAAYYGAKKACEKVHIQYAYDDDSVYVVNALREAQNDLKATAVILDDALEEKHRNEALVSVGPDGVTKAFALEIPADLSKTYFLKLTLSNAEEKVISDNFYWLSTTKDVPGKSRYTKERIFYTEPESRADFTALNSLPPVKLESKTEVATENEEQVVRVTVSNPTDKLAFLIQLSLIAGEGGQEIAPSFWEDNYFSLLPGESRTTTTRVYTRDLNGATPTVRIQGWNCTAAGS